MSAHGYECIWEPGLIFSYACSAALFVCFRSISVIPLNAEEKSASAFMTFSPAKHLNSVSLRMKKWRFRHLHLTVHLLADWLKQQWRHFGKCFSTPLLAPCCFEKLPAVCVNLNPELGEKTHKSFLPLSSWTAPQRRTRGENVSQRNEMGSRNSNAYRQQIWKQTGQRHKRLNLIA